MRISRINRISLIIIALILAPVVPFQTIGQIPEAVAVPPFQKGVTYTTWPVGRFGTPDADAALSYIPSLGANWIALIVTQYQATIDSTTIFPIETTETDGELVHAIQQAHQLGLKVMLKPHIDILNSTANNWRGLIGEHFTQSQWQEWFDNYENFIVHYAIMAEANEVEQFCIGVELDSTVEKAEQWRSLIAEVRQVYQGPITYAALRDKIGEVSWWDSVDFIGIDLYFSFKVSNDPTIEQIKAAWAPVVPAIADTAAKWGMQVLITEIGYMSQDGTLQHPWNWLNEDGVVDLQEQADAYQAAFEVFYDQPWLSGMYWWDYGTDPFEGGPCDQRYTPHGKPAEEILRRWYQGVLKTKEAAPPQRMIQSMAVYQDTLSPGWSNEVVSGTVNLASTTVPPFGGSAAISAALSAHGSITFRHNAFQAGPYQWLEFGLRKQKIGEQIRVAFIDQDANILRKLPLCRFMTGAITPDTWNRVLIPLTDLDASEKRIAGIAFLNVAGIPQAFWVDEIRLMDAFWKLRLPMLTRIN